MFMSIRNEGLSRLHRMAWAIGIPLWTWRTKPERSIWSLFDDVKKQNIINKQNTLITRAKHAEF